LTEKTSLGDRRGAASKTMEGLLHEGGFQTKIDKSFYFAQKRRKNIYNCLKTGKV